jgi:outer membrane protein OmpA-like peptidoglycan-associated protein
MWNKMNLHRLLPVLLVSLLATACTAFAPAPPPAINVAAVADPFQRGLAQGYSMLGNTEASEWDYRAAGVMHAKAADAAAGRLVPVADPDWWNDFRGHPWNAGRWRTMITGSVRVTAYDYRNRLVPWIEANKARDPVTTSGQQVAYECWLEEMTEDDYEDAAKCGLNPALWVAVAAAPAPAPAPAPAAAPNTYLVFFDFDRSDIPPEAAAVIRQAATDARSMQVRVVVVTGHADRSGPTDYNQRLSERRANAVRNALVREGVPNNIIQTAGRGENDNLVQTADGVREPRNRRVEIAFR